MKTILGIIPQYPKHTQNNIYSKIVMPPVGIISVLTNLAHKYNVICIDENNYSGPLDHEGLPDHSFLNDELRPDYVFLYGGMTNSILRGYAISRIYKRFGATVVAGGSHVEAEPREALSKGIDYVVHGEGEQVTEDLLDSIEQGVRPTSKGISYLDKGYFFTGKRSPISDPDEFKLPDLRIVKFLKKRFSAVPVSWGLGCPYKCEFCVVNKQYGNYKARSIEKVMEQIITYSDLGFKNFFFTNDNFAHDIDAAIALSKKIGDYKRKFSKKINLIVQVRSEIAKRNDLIEAMKYAGVTTLAIGYESPINEELNAMRKGVTMEKLISRSRKLSEHFYLHGMFIFGYPSIKRSQLTLKERALRYRRFFKKAKIDSIQIFKAIPLPGTELRSRLKKEGRLLPLEIVNWDKYDGLFLCYDPRPDGYDPHELQNIPNDLMKLNYSGSLINTTLNYGYWINWTYNATIGFPIYFLTDFTRRFLFNLLNKRRVLKVRHRLLPHRNIWMRSLLSVWRDIRRKWRNQVIKNMASGMYRRWQKDYKKIGYKNRIESYFSSD